MNKEQWVEAAMPLLGQRRSVGPAFVIHPGTYHRCLACGGRFISPVTVRPNETLTHGGCSLQVAGHGPEVVVD